MKDTKENTVIKVNYVYDKTEKVHLLLYGSFIVLSYQQLTRDGQFAEEDGCKPDPCIHGECENNGPGEHICICWPGFTGEYCEDGKITF